MATTHGVTLAMMSSYIPTTQVAGIGKISGTAWSLTDFIFGMQFLPQDLNLLQSAFCSLQCASTYQASQSLKRRLFVRCA